ncbi:MAG: immune inhibitor A domain-containing protein [Ornithinibacter sp.]
MTDRSWTFRTAATIVALAAASATVSTVAVAQAADTTSTKASAVDRNDPQPAKAREHDFDGPLTKTREAQRQEALDQVISGNATVKNRNGSQVVELKSRKGDSKYVELGREKTDKIFTILVEFGDQVDPRYGGTVGPLHNQIAQPDRKQDNSTAWQADYNQAHFQDLYFGTGKKTESLKKYYEKQSSGRYSVEGEVTDWVKVPYNEARYGSNDAATGAWYAVQDGVNAWVAEREAAGDTAAEIRAELAEFDQWDRYDFDGDGNFNEPDGYIDHFQIVHAGEDESAGGGAQGEDAIWAHRWYAFGTDAGATGPENNKLGGAKIGDTGIWVGDYTVQPENGGLGVYAHEYGHDLGLPDHYDTAGGENGVNWWNLMAQSRLNAPQDQAIGTRPGDLSAWDKLQLGWLDYEIVNTGQRRTMELGPHEYNSKKAQAVVVNLPDKTVTTELGAPRTGTKQWYSGAGDNLESTMSRSVTLPAGSASLSFQARWNIEDCDADACDYAYVEVNDGTGFKAVAGNITKGAEGNGIDGYQAAWTPASFDLSAYAGKTVTLRVRYSTDGAAQGNNPDVVSGIFVDDIVLTANGTTLLTDGAETSPNGWTLDGFSSVGASSSQDFQQHYIASNREYVSFDKYLKTGPYNFGFPNKPDFVEHFPYQDGLLISYWDTSQSDNNTSQHPGEGLILPIDAHPRTVYKLDGQPWRPRIQMYDATFGLQKVDSFTLHDQVTGQASYLRGQNGNPLFDDSNPNRYFKTDQPTAGVKVAGSGTTIRVLDERGTSVKIRIDTRAATR